MMSLPEILMAYGYIFRYRWSASNTEINVTYVAVSHAVVKLSRYSVTCCSEDDL